MVQNAKIDKRWVRTPRFQMKVNKIFRVRRQLCSTFSLFLFIRPKAHSCERQKNKLNCGCGSIVPYIYADRQNISKCIAIAAMWKTAASSGSHTAASPLHSRDIHIGIYGLQFTAEVINKIMHSHRYVNISSIAPSRPFEIIASLLSHKTRRVLCCGGIVGAQFCTQCHADPFQAPTGWISRMKSTRKVVVSPFH